MYIFNDICFFRNQITRVFCSIILLVDRLSKASHFKHDTILEAKICFSFLLILSYVLTYLHITKNKTTNFGSENIYLHNIKSNIEQIEKQI